MNLYESISQETINSIKRDAIKKEVDFLIKDEEEAIDGYEKSKQTLSKYDIPSDEYIKIVKVYDHIIGEEKEHIRELEELLGSENSKSSLNEADNDLTALSEGIAKYIISIMQKDTDLTNKGVKINTTIQDNKIEVATYQDGKPINVQLINIDEIKRLIK